MYDITLTGSLVGGGYTIEEADRDARRASKAFPGRLIRLYQGGTDVLVAEYRDGHAAEPQP
jgi:hypothetical protein